MKIIIRGLSLITIWVAVMLVLPYRTWGFDLLFIIWAGVTLSIMVMVLTHFHFKQWGPEIKGELEKMKLKLINERSLTIFEIAQFADTEYFTEIVSRNFKRIIEVESDQGRRKICIRIRKNYLSNTIELHVLGDVS